MTAAPPRAIAGLAELAPRYDALLCDVWGVIHNGRESFPAACAALARFRAERGPVILISNAPRPCGPVVEQRGKKLVYCGGALAQLYESLGGRVTMAGKPYAPIYELSLAKAAETLGRPLDPARV